MKKLLLVLAILSVSSTIGAIDRISFDNLTGQTLDGQWVRQDDNTSQILTVAPSFRTVNFGTPVLNFQLSLTQCNFNTGLIEPKKDKYVFDLVGGNCDKYKDPCSCTLKVY